MTYLINEASDERRLAPSTQARAVPRFSIAVATLVLGLIFLFPDHVAAQEQPRLQVETVGLIVRPHGFDASTLEVSAGLVSIVVYNHAGADLDIAIDRQQATGPPERVRQKLATKARRKWKDVVRLTPGNYTVSVAGRPDWSIELLVTPN